ncbi:MAG: histidine kinase dimerization/phospho-acceptor domain-containing protein [Cyanobacteria bacterium P01_F01_bin.150]
MQRLITHLGIAIQRIDGRHRQSELEHFDMELEHKKLTLLRQLAHNYRTPLTKILAAAETIEKHSNTLDLGTQKRFLLLIKDQILYLNQVTNNVLNVS